MIRTVTVTTLLLMITASNDAVHASQRAAHHGQACTIEVLYSEELPIGPLFHHTIKANLLVMAPDRPAFETTIYRVIPWQVPPPRRGQRIRLQCVPELVTSSFAF